MDDGTSSIRASTLASMDDIPVLPGSFLVTDR